MATNQSLDDYLKQYSSGAATPSSSEVTAAPASSKSSLDEYLSGFSSGQGAAKSSAAPPSSAPSALDAYLNQYSSKPAPSRPVTGQGGGSPLAEVPSPHLYEDETQPWYKRAWDFANTPLTESILGMPETRAGAGGFERGLERIVGGLTSPVSLALTAATFGTGSLLESAGASALREAGLSAEQIANATKASQVALDTFKAAPSVDPAISEALSVGGHDLSLLNRARKLVGPTNLDTEMGRSSVQEFLAKKGFTETELADLAKTSDTIKKAKEGFTPIEDAISAAGHDVDNWKTAQDILYKNGLTEHDLVGGNLVERGAYKVLRNTVPSLPVAVTARAAKTANTLLNGGFTFQQLQTAAAMSPLFLDALKEGDYDKAWEYGTEATVSGLMGVAGTPHFLHSAGELFKPLVETDKFRPNDEWLAVDRANREREGQHAVAEQEAIRVHEEALRMLGHEPPRPVIGDSPTVRLQKLQDYALTELGVHTGMDAEKAALWHDALVQAAGRTDYSPLSGNLPVGDPIKTAELPVKANTEVLHDNSAGEVRVGSDGRPVVWLHPEAWARLRERARMGEADGISLSNAEAAQVVGRDEKEYSDIRDLMDTARGAAAANQTAVAGANVGVGDVRVVGEELHHTFQRELSKDQDVNNLFGHVVNGQKVFDRLHDIIPGAQARELARLGYGEGLDMDAARRLHVVETGAQFLSGNLPKDIPDEEVANWLKEYRKELIAVHGEDALSKLDNINEVAKQHLEDINAARETAARTAQQGADQGVLGSRREGGQGPAGVGEAKPEEGPGLKGASREEDLRRVYHWSRKPFFTETDPEMAGTGVRGAERDRAQIKGTYFGDETYREPMVQGNARKYFADIDYNKFYDRAEDPLGLIEKAKALTVKNGDPVEYNFEKLVKDNGYSGYRARNVIKSFEKVPVRPDYGLTEVKDPSKFYNAINKVKEAYDKSPDPNRQGVGKQVHVYSPEEYKDMRLFLSPDGKTGGALKGDDMVSGFSHPTDTPKATAHLLETLIKNGGRRADAFDTYLPEIYAQHGMRVVARMPWNDEYAPEGWDYEKMKKFNGGRPDVVFMAYDPTYKGPYVPGEGVPVDSYAEGEVAQRDALNRQEEPEPELAGALYARSRDWNHISKYLSPEEIKKHNTDEKKNSLVAAYNAMPDAEELNAAVRAGRAGQMWYERSSRAFDALLDSGFDRLHPEDRDKFLNFVAALSPVQPVRTNLLMALEMWAKWDKAGRPTDVEWKDGQPKSKTSSKLYQMMRKGVDLKSRLNNAIKALQGEPLSGPKVSAFTKNLGTDVNRVTNDTWMAVLAGQDPNRVNQPAIYDAMSATIREAAESNNMNPRQAQAAAWSFIKSLAELSGWGKDRWMAPQEIIKQGLLTPDLVAARSADFADLLQNDPKIRELIKKLGGDTNVLDENLKNYVPERPAEGEAPELSDRLLGAAGRLEAARTNAKIARHLEAKVDNQGSFDFGATEFNPSYLDQATGAVTPLGAKFMPLLARTRAENPEVRKLAEEYTKERGIEKTPHEGVAPVNPETAKRIADAYERMQHNPNDPEVRRSYDALKRETKAQWDAAEKAGFRFEPWTKEGQPYATSADMAADVRSNKHLYFFQGGDIPADHPLAAIDPKTGLTYNDIFRAVHDLFGHAKNDYEFGPKGEENAFLTHSRMYSDTAVPALLSETKGQNSWVNYGQHLRDGDGNIPAKGEPGHIPAPERPYAEQKAGLLPPDVVREATTPAPKVSPELEALRDNYRQLVQRYAPDASPEVKGAVSKAFQRMVQRFRQEFPMASGKELANFTQLSGQFGLAGKSRENVAPEWYLKSNQLIDSRMQGPMPADTVKKMLENNGVKPDELKYTGLDEFLKSKGKEPVRPEELREYLAANNLQIKEVTKGRPANYGNYEVYDLNSGNRLKEFSSREEAEKYSQANQGTEWARILSGESPTRYSSYVLPGGENYREMLLTLPDQQRKKLDVPKITFDDLMKKDPSVAKDFDESLFSYADRRIPAEDRNTELNNVLFEKSRYVDPEIQQKIRELYPDIAEQHRQNRSESDRYINNTFKSSHWDDPNVVGHIRFNDRVGPNGERLLHLEELQSDWHQKGRTQGYKTTDEEKSKLEAQWKQMYRDERPLRHAADEVLDALDSLGYDSNSQARSAIFNHPDWAQRWDVQDPRDVETIQKWVDHRREVERLQKLAGSDDRRVPDAPFKKTWPELLMKRMIRYAAENGYDGISWTPGEEQAGRYDLSKQVDHVSYFPETKELVATKDGAPILRETVDKEKLPDYVGKEAAKKLLDSPLIEPKSEFEKPAHHAIFGDDLKVGGTGMKGFYDKMLPEMTNKLIKQYGSKVGETNIGTGKPRYTVESDGGEFVVWDGRAHGDRGGDVYVPEGSEDPNIGPVFKTREEAENYIRKNLSTENMNSKKVSYFPITDSMRETVLKQGQPLFAKTRPDNGLPEDLEGKIATNKFKEQSPEYQKRVLDALRAIATKQVPENVQNAIKYLREQEDRNYEMGSANGLLDHYIDDHMKRVWKDKNPSGKVITAQGRGGQFSTRVTQAQHRVYDSTLTGLLKSPDELEMNPARTTAQGRADLIKAAANKKLIQNLRDNFTRASDGRPAVVLSGSGRVVTGPNGEDPTTFINPNQVQMLPVADGVVQHLTKTGDLERFLEEGSLKDITPYVHPDNIGAAIDRLEEQAGRKDAQYDQVGNNKLRTQIMMLKSMMNNKDYSGLKEFNDGLKKQYAWDPQDYITINHPAMRGWNFATNDSAGNKILVDSQIRVHPEYAEYLKNRLGMAPSTVSEHPIGKALLKTGTKMKETLLSLSPFHMVQEALRGIMVGINPFHITGPDILSGERINPSDPNSPTIIHKAVEQGFTPGTDFKSMQEHSEGVAAGGEGLLKMIPGVGKPIANAMNWYQDFLFKRYIPALKARAVELLYHKYQDAHPEWSTDKIARAAASHANDTFGGINWKQMGRSATTQDWARMFLLAPDWLESEMRSGIRLFNREGDVSRAQVAKMALGLWGIARVLNLVTTGNAHYEAPFGLAVKNKEGKETIFSIRTLPTDLLHAATDPVGFLKGRLSPTVRTGEELLSGRDTYGRKLSPQDMWVDAFRQMAPIPLQSLGQAISATGSGVGNVGQTWKAVGGTAQTYATPAADTAAELAANHNEDGPVDPAVMARHRMVMQFEDKVRSGEISFPDLVKMTFNTGQLKEAELKKIQTNLQKTKGMDSTMAALYTRASRLPAREYLDVYDKMNPSERAALLPLTQSVFKRYTAKALKEMTPEERAKDQTLQRILNLMHPGAGIVRAPQASPQPTQ